MTPPPPQLPGRRPGSPTVFPPKAGALAPPGGPQRQDAQPPAPSRPDAPSPAASAPLAGALNLDFPAGSSPRSPDAHQRSRRPEGCASGRSTSTPRDSNRRDASDAKPLLFTREAAARRLSISVRQLSRFIADGSIKPVRLGPRLVRFTPEELAAFVAGCGPDVEPPAWPERLLRRHRQ
jgi:excisionase family DNA binding protein